MTITATLVWRLQLYMLECSPRPIACMRLAELRAHRISGSQVDFWPARRRAGGNRRGGKSGGKHASDVDDDVNSEGFPSDDEFDVAMDDSMFDDLLDDVNERRVLTLTVMTLRHRPRQWHPCATADLVWLGIFLTFNV